MEGTQSTSDVSQVDSESSAEIVDVEPLRDFESEKYAIQGFVVDYFTYRIEKNGYEWYERPSLPYENLVEYKTMRDVALIFERRYSNELNDMVDTLLANKYLSFQRYVQVVEHFERSDENFDATATVTNSNSIPLSHSSSPSLSSSSLSPLPASGGIPHMSYGRLVVLLAFGGLVVCRLAEQQMRNEISAIAMYTWKFLEKPLQLYWAKHNCSWADFMKRAEKIKCREALRERERQAVTARARARRWQWIGIATVGVVGIGAFTLTRAVLSR